MKQFLHPKLLKLDQDLNEIEFFQHNPSLRVKRSGLRKIYSQALGAARETFTLVSPYYIPDRNFLKMIAKANRRGVKVNIILPFRTDHKIMNYLAQAFFDLTARAGAKLYLLKNMNHAKGFAVDGKIGVVGSGNLNSRSWFIDEEAGVKFSNKNMVNDLNNILNDWLGKACLVDIGKKEKSWDKRLKSWWVKKIKEIV